MSMPNPPDQTTWRVTGQNEQTRIDPAGNPVRGVVVFYQTGTGAQGSVFVPYVQYNPSSVAEAVRQAAVSMDAVAGLSSDNHPG